MRSFDRRLATLETRTTTPPSADADPRLRWHLWPSPDRPAVLAFVDFVAAHATVIETGVAPTSIAAAAHLPPLARELLTLVWDAYSVHPPETFTAAVAGYVEYDTEVVYPVWAIQDDATRTTLHHRLLPLVWRFPSEGHPTYASHRTYRADAWPERAHWSDAERRMMGELYAAWERHTAPDADGAA